MKNQRGFVILFDGDPDAGLNDEQWTIEGDFYFDDKDELNDFKKRLQETFEVYCCGKVTVNSFNEIDEMNNHFFEAQS